MTGMVAGCLVKRQITTYLKKANPFQLSTWIEKNVHHAYDKQIISMLLFSGIA